MTEYERETTENKISAVNELGVIIRIAENQIRRAKDIPVLDDEYHADLVRGFAERIHDIMLDMEDLMDFGHAKGVLQ